MSDFINEGWSFYVAAITGAGLIFCIVLLLIASRRRVMSNDNTTGHVWDEDLKEMNNPLPRWWMGLFVLTVVFSIIYLVIYPGFGSHEGSLKWSSTGQWQAEQDKARVSMAPVYAAFADQSAEQLAKNPQAMAIGIKVDAPWRGCEQLTLGDAAMRVVYCPSVLAFREQLAQAETEKLVLLTNQKEQELGSDVLYRLALSRLHEVRPWQVILERFQARRWDSRLTKEPWMEAPLLRIVAEKQSLTPAPGGFLDEETIWRELLTELLRLSEPRPSAKTLLRWSLSREGLVAWAQLPNDAKMGIGAHLVEQIGRASCRERVSSPV